MSGQMRHLKHMYIAIIICATSPSSVATSIYKTCNILLKHLKHTLTTYAFSIASTCCSNGGSSMRSSKPRSGVWGKMDANGRAAVRPPMSCCVAPGDRVGRCLLQGRGDSAARGSVPHAREVSGRRVARWSQPQKRMCALKEGPGGEE
jgi:hypothetical protein